MKPLQKSRKPRKKLFDDIDLNDKEKKHQAQSSYANALNYQQHDQQPHQQMNQISSQSSAMQHNIKPKNVFNQYETFQQKKISNQENLQISPRMQQFVNPNQQQSKLEQIRIDNQTNLRKSSEQNFIFKSMSISDQQDTQKKEDQQNNQRQQKINEYLNPTKRKLLDSPQQIDQDSTINGSSSLLQLKRMKLNVKPVKVTQLKTFANINVNQPQNQQEDHYNKMELNSPDILKKKIQSNKYLQFASKQIEKGYQLKLIIKRQTKNMGWSVSYHAHFQSDDRYLMSAFKMSHSHMLTHHMSIDPQVSSQNSRDYLGKTKSNFMQNAINILSKGYSPQQSYKDPNNCRQVLATVVLTNDVIYESSIPKNIKVFVLKKQYEYFQLQGYKQNEEINLEDLYQHHENKKKIIVLRNRRPIWKQQTKCFVLDFHGMVKIASSKNFILELDDPKNKNKTQQILLFGKIQKDKYLLDISSPLSPCVAFGIAVTICNVV